MLGSRCWVCSSSALRTRNEVADGKMGVADPAAFCILSQIAERKVWTTIRLSKVQTRNRNWIQTETQSAPVCLSPTSKSPTKRLSAPSSNFSSFATTTARIHSWKWTPHFWVKCISRAGAASRPVGAPRDDLGGGHDDSDLRDLQFVGCFSNSSEHEVTENERAEWRLALSLGG